MSDTEIDDIAAAVPSLALLITAAVVAAGGEINISREVFEVRGVSTEIIKENDDSITLRVVSINNE